MRKEKAITLISLVITIVILIILASVAIYLSLGNNGIFNRAKFAKQEYINVAEEEQKQLNDVYGQMLVATGEDATVTMTMKQLNDLIDERSNRKLYIDTSKKIADLTQNVEYEATKDCIIVGYMNAYSFSGFDIEIDDIVIMGYVNNNPKNVAAPININLKTGQKIIFKTKGNDCYLVASVYETL